jgi:HSP20 family protein
MMSDLMRRGPLMPDPRTPFGRMDRLIDEWFRGLPMGLTAAGLQDEELIKVDEFRDGDTLVVRAELPGIDPEKDAAVTVQDGVLTIRAERRIEEDRQDRGYRRHEIRYGTMTRSLPVPDGVADSDITAAYKDGMLEVRMPLPAPPSPAEPTTIPVTTG